MAGAADDDWGSLMAAAQDGHGGAYHRLFEALRGWLVQFYARRLPLAMVDDAVQDTLIAVHKSVTYDRAHPFRPWLAAIAWSGSTGCAR